VFKNALLRGGLILLATISLPAQAATGKDVYQALGIKVKDVLTGTVLNAKILPGDDKQVASVVTFFTGKRDKAEAVNVQLAIFTEHEDGLGVVYMRDFGAEQGGYVGAGDLVLLDLDRDGASEIVVCYDDYREPLIDRRVCEVILREETGFRAAWSGPVKYDATKAVRDVPAERRDRFAREFDWPGTMRTKGATLHIDKKVISVAGERLAEPRMVRESFPLKETSRPY